MLHQYGIIKVAEAINENIIASFLVLRFIHVLETFYYNRYGGVMMTKRSAEIISKEINEKIVVRTKLMTTAQEIVLKELTKYDNLSYTANEADNTIIIKGIQYGEAILNLNHWFGMVRELDPPEKLASEMMEDIKQQLLPERDYSM